MPLTILFKFYIFTFMNKLPLFRIFCIFFAAVLTFSCSGDDGSDGAAGMPGDPGTNGNDGATPVCDPDTKTWRVGTTDTGIKCLGTDGQAGDPGLNGKNCSVADDPEDSAYLEMSCDGTDTSERWPKAMCGAEAYDPQKRFCYRGSTVDLCGDKSYNPSSQFCDDRDDRIYKLVKIGEQVWMAENLNYATGRCVNLLSGSGSFVDDNTPACDVYGRLYSWDTAMDGACPQGWHLPSDGEWTELIDFAEATPGTKLKAKSSLWFTNDGTDEFGFAALPGGGGDGDSFSNVGTHSLWWSATQSYATAALYYYILSGDSDVKESQYGKSTLFSIRCVRN